MFSIPYPPAPSFTLTTHWRSAGRAIHSLDPSATCRFTKPSTLLAAPRKHQTHPQPSSPCATRSRPTTQRARTTANLRSMASHASAPLQQVCETGAGSRYSSVSRTCKVSAHDALRISTSHRVPPATHRAAHPVTRAADRPQEARDRAHQARICSAISGGCEVTSAFRRRRATALERQHRVRRPPKSHRRESATWRWRLLPWRSRRLRAKRKASSDSIRRVYGGDRSVGRMRAYGSREMLLEG